MKRKASVYDRLFSKLNGSKDIKRSQTINIAMNLADLPLNESIDKTVAICPDDFNGGSPVSFGKKSLAAF